MTLLTQEMRWFVALVCTSAQLAAQNAPSDHFADRPALTGAPVEATFSTRNATFEPGDDVLRIRFGWDRSVWWKWTAPQSGDVLVQAFPAPGSTRKSGALAVLVGDTAATLSVLSFTPIDGYLRAFSFRAESGRTYNIMAAASGEFEGNFSLSFTNFPVILRQPRSENAVVHGVFLDVVAIPGPDPSFPYDVEPRLTYQWFRNDVPMPGRTNEFFYVEHPTWVDSGMYRCVIKDSTHSTTTLAARVELNWSFVNARILPRLAESGRELVLSITGDEGNWFELQKSRHLEGWQTMVAYQGSSGPVIGFRLGSTPLELRVPMGADRELFRVHQYRPSFREIVNRLRVIETRKNTWARNARIGIGNSPALFDLFPSMSDNMLGWELGELGPPMLGEIYNINVFGNFATVTLPAHVGGGGISPGGVVYIALEFP